jgi:seryl-tRNA synthetase
MFSATEGDLSKSEEVHQEMLEIQENLFTQLGLHFRILDMPTEELGGSAYRKYDIEAWMPSKNGYGEISSTSNCTNYQSSRLSCQYFDRNLEKRLIHTINGTCLNDSQELHVQRLD